MSIEPSRRHMIALWTILVIIQINDVFIHWAFAQVEPLRLAANLILLVGSIIAYFRLSRNYLLVGFTLYAVSNLTFIWHEGWLNEHDELRIPLITLVIFTTIITVLLDRLYILGLIKRKTPRPI